MPREARGTVFALEIAAVRRHPGGQPFEAVQSVALAVRYLARIARGALRVGKLSVAPALTHAFYQNLGASRVGAR